MFMKLRHVKSKADIRSYRSYDHERERVKCQIKKQTHDHLDRVSNEERELLVVTGIAFVRGKKVLQSDQ